MPSNKKRSAFYHFMVTRKRQLEAQGTSFRGGLREVAEYVNCEWINMSDEQKKEFDFDKKLEFKNPDDPPKFANIKEKIRWEDKKKLELEQTLAAEIGTWVKNHEDTIENMKFVIIDFNVWGVDNDGIYVPAEIGMVTFSLSEGVIDNYGNLIDPRKIDLGMGCDVLRSEEEFDLPRPPFDYDVEGKNISYLLNSIFWFTNKCNETMIPGQLFCRRESTDIVNGCLAWLCKHSGLSHNFKVYPFEHLVIKLKELKEEKLTEEDGETTQTSQSTFTESAACATTGLLDVPSTSSDFSAASTFWDLDGLLSGPFNATGYSATATSCDKDGVLADPSNSTGSTPTSCATTGLLADHTNSPNFSVTPRFWERDGPYVYHSFNEAPTFETTAELTSNSDSWGTVEPTVASTSGATRDESFPSGWSFKFFKEIPPMSFEEIRRKKWAKVQSADISSLTEEDKARYRKCLDPPVADPLVEVRTILNSVSLYGIKHMGCFHHMQNWSLVHKCALSKVNGYAYLTLRYLLPKFGISAKQSAHYPDDSMMEHETIVHTLMMKNWGLEPKQYPSYMSLEKRKQIHSSIMAEIDSRSDVSEEVKLEDLYLSLIPPLFRPKPPSPTYRLLSSKTVKLQKKKKN